MTPGYLEDQLGRSLRNLGVDSIDVYYLHNPETQLSEVLRPDFLERVRDAFICLESAAAAGNSQFYRVATSDGIRQGGRARDPPPPREISPIPEDNARKRDPLPLLALPLHPPTSTR